MTAKKAYYLGKGGQTYGPYTDEELNQFHVSGKIHGYNWIWDAHMSQWKPLDPPPPPIHENRQDGVGLTSEPLPAATGATSFRPQTQTQTQTPSSPDRRALPGLPLKGYDQFKVICHDFSSMVSGTLSQVTDSGCCLESEDQDSSPVFSTESGVLMNLLDPKSGRTVNVKAQLSGVKRTDTGWSYQIHWAAAPEL